MTYPRPTLIQVCAFLKRHHPAMRNWKRAALVPFVEWYWRDARVGVIREQGKIVGVALARLLETPEQATREYYHTEHGSILWCQDIVTTRPDGMGLLLEVAERRFGRREKVGGDIFKRPGDTCLFPWSFIERFTKRIPNGQH